MMNLVDFDEAVFPLDILLTTWRPLLDVPLLIIEALPTTLLKVIPLMDILEIELPVFSL